MNKTILAATALLLTAVSSFAGGLMGPPGLDAGGMASSEEMLANAISAPDSCIKQNPAAGDASQMTQVLKDRNACLAMGGGMMPMSPMGMAMSGGGMGMAGAAQASPGSYPASSDTEPPQPSTGPTPSPTPHGSFFANLKDLGKKGLAGLKGMNPFGGKHKGVGFWQDLTNAIPFALTGLIIASFLGGPLVMAAVAGAVLVGAFAFSALATRGAGADDSSS